MARTLSKIPKGKVKSFLVTQREKLSQQKHDKEQARKAANAAQHEKEKAARAKAGMTGYGYSGHLMGGSASTSGYRRTFEEFIAICEEKADAESKPPTPEEKRKIRMMQQLERLNKLKSASRIQSDVAKEEE